jgi:hypothetical protein
MSYVIQYIDKEDGIYEMDGVGMYWLGDHLNSIAEQEGITYEAFSESHLLAILRDKGVEIKLLDEDGSELTW